MRLEDERFVTEEEEIPCELTELSANKVQDGDRPQIGEKIGSNSKFIKSNLVQRLFIPLEKQ